MPFEIGVVVQAESLREHVVVVAEQFLHLLRAPQVVKAFVALGIGLLLIAAIVWSVLFAYR